MALCHKNTVKYKIVIGPCHPEISIHVHYCKKFGWSLYQSARATRFTDRGTSSAVASQGERGEGALWCPFYQPSSLITGLHPHALLSSQRTHQLIPLPPRIWISTCASGGDTSTQATVETASSALQPFPALCPHLQTLPLTPALAPPPPSQADALDMCSSSL